VSWASLCRLKRACAGRCSCHSKLGRAPVQACTAAGLEVFDGIKRWREAQALSAELRSKVHALQ
jgi:hypothetical protein